MSPEGAAGPTPLILHPTAEIRGGFRASLPGSGEPGPHCGQALPTHVCTEHHATGRPWVRVITQECLLRICPNCAGRCEGGDRCPAHLKSHSGGKWAHAEGKRAARKFERFLAAQNLSRTALRQVIVSPPPECFPEDGDHQAMIESLRARAEGRVRAWAWQGRYFGSAVVHPYRGCDQAPGGYDVWGPHVHLICAGIDVRRVEDYYRRTRWVVKQAKAKSGGWAPYRGAALYRHLVYELGHCAIVPKGHALTWFGTISRWTDDEDPVAAAEPIECPDHHLMREWTEQFGLGARLVHTLDGWSVQWVGCGGLQSLSVRVFPGPPERDGRWAA